MVEVKKIDDENTTSRIFLDKVKRLGHPRVIHKLSQRIRRVGCPIGPSEEIDAIMGFSRLADEPAQTVPALKSVLRTYLAKNSSCSKIFDKEWKDYFGDVLVKSVDADEKEKKITDKDIYVQSFLNNAASNFYKKIEEKGTFKFDEESFFDRFDNNKTKHDQTSSESLKLAEKAFAKCKTGLGKGTASDWAFNCLNESLNVIKKYQNEVINEGNYSKVMEIDSISADAIRHLKTFIDKEISRVS